MARSGARIFKNAGFSETMGARPRAGARQDGARRAPRHQGRRRPSSTCTRSPIRCGRRSSTASRALNYGELEERINRLTHGLRTLGVGPGERIGRVPLQRARVPGADGGAQRRRRRQRADRLSAQGGRGRLHPRELGRARAAVPRRSRARRRGGADARQERQHRPRALHRHRRRRRASAATRICWRGGDAPAPARVRRRRLRRRHDLHLGHHRPRQGRHARLPPHGHGAGARLHLALPAAPRRAPPGGLPALPLDGGGVRDR